MKKIGVVTFFSNYNYGSSLQAYSLCSYINNMGYECHIIDYLDYDNPINVKLHIKTYMNRLFGMVCHPSIAIETLKGKKKAIDSINRDKTITDMYDQFNNDFLKPYKGNYLDFDAFVCGSDQVWKLTSPGLHEVFFLRFVGSNKRIAYAVSLGTDEIPKYNKRRFKKYISEFKAISVREDDSKKLLKNELNIDTVQVLDPVLLVGDKFWEEIIRNMPSYQKNYLVCYFLDDYSDQIEFILGKAESLECDIIIIESDIIVPEAIKQKATSIKPTPFEFVKLIHDSKGIFTDSFHGMAFSILFNKLFWGIPRKYKVYAGQRNRIDSLLRLTDLCSRYCENGADAGNAIDFSIANENIADMRDVSARFLQSVLGEM